MKAIIQRCKKASVIADGVLSGEIENGLFVLLGVQNGDGDAEAELLAKKVSDLRIFCDSEDKMNLSVKDVDGEVLVVSNFTLCADTKKGNRPSFINALKPPDADRLYEYFKAQLTENGVKKVESGVFGADMEISTELLGPVTITLDTDIWRK